MLGVIYTAASDFSSFSYAHSHDCLEICHETHVTSIEERYCPKAHIDASDDKEWDRFIQHQARHFDEFDRVSTSTPGTRFPLSVNTVLDAFVDTPKEDILRDEDPPSDDLLLVVPPTTPVSACTVGTPSLVGGDDDTAEKEDSESEDEEDFEYQKLKNKRLALTVMAASNRKRKTKRSSSNAPKPARPVKMLKRSESFSSVSSEASVTSISSAISSSTAAFLQSMAGAENPWKCPHCPWIQHTQRLPDFLRHQRSHFVSQSDWPCPNPKCGKGFARKDSLKRHLDNKATGCKRPPGYIVC